MKEGEKKLKIEVDREQGIVLNVLQVLYLKKYEVTFLEVRAPYVYLIIRDSSSGNGKSVLNAVKMLPGVKNVEEVEEIESEGYKEEGNKERASYLKKGNTLHEIIDEVEKEVITEALNNYESARKAAKALGVSHTTVLNKIKKFGEETYKEKVDKDKKNCEICGDLIEDGGRFCENCEIIKSSKVETVNEDKGEETKINCSNCGTLLKYGAIFCPNCFSS